MPSTGPAENSGSALDPETVARRRARLERRIANLEYDIRRAESAERSDSRWRRRIGEISAAVEQAQAELGALQAAPEPADEVPLPALEIAAMDVQTEIPATVQFTIGSEAFRYSEEVDWTERGEQRALPGLRRFAGDPVALLPPAAPADRRADLEEHLRHALGALAIALRDGALDPAQPLTLADLAAPCPVCGNWHDHRGRCINCQRRVWRANEIRSEINRLVEERNGLLEEMASQREALPILQRQLRDARLELAKYADDS